MAKPRKTSAGRWELCIQHKLLPRRVYLTFDDEDSAEAYRLQVYALLRAGVVPAGLVEDKPAPRERLALVLQAWINSGTPAPTELDTLQRLRSEVGALRLDDLTYTWADGWVRDLKLLRNLAPSTIRKRVGALSRCLDDYLRHHPDLQISNPLRLLPRGAASYNAQDAARVAKGGGLAKTDVVRDRRLAPGEYAAIIAALGGAKRPDRERALDLPQADALRMLFLLIFYSGVRLREAYTLTAGQVLLVSRTLRVRSSKQWYGRVAHRDVPLRPELHAALTYYMGLQKYAPADLIFPWWDGDAATLDRATSRLSGQFSRLFDYAGIKGLTEHDLRHEATCCWYELKAADGHWMFRDKEIERIMGWAPGSKMASRYASFRAEDLAARLWL